MQRQTIAVGSYEVNCSILTEADRAYIVDPGQEAGRILSILEKKAAHPAAVLLTHAHFDHITAIADLQKAFPQLPVYVHESDWPMFGHPFNQFPGEYSSIGKPANLRPVDEIAREAGQIAVIPTPGHTPGGVCYYLAHEKLLLSGDTLFAGSIGRTDFPGGDMTAMLESLKRLMELPDDTLVVPGHGSFTTIGEERRANPYIV